MASTGASSFTLRPWPAADKKPKNLGEFIARVNVEKGGFRNVTEAQLREEIKAQEEGRDQDDSQNGDSESESEADSGKDKTIVEAREDFLRHIELAHTHTALTLEFVSLLLSKESPVSASTTLSMDTREAVGIGTLGATMLKGSNVTQESREDHRAVATGWRVMGINKMVDSVVAAAEKLEKEINLETKYWADVLSVSEQGWAVCPLPQDKHTLGVRFGFAESAIDFKNNSIAPLRRNSDGTVRIEHGRLGGGSQRVRVRVEEDGQLIGASALPARPPPNAPLPDQVLEARNTIFAQELWYELNREARMLLSSGVRSDETSIIFEPESQHRNTKIIVTLEDLPDEPEDSSHLPATSVAEPSNLRLQLNLCAAHRSEHRQRAQRALSSLAQPPQAANRPSPPFSILRPLVARERYDGANETLSLFLTDLTALLERAGINTATWSRTVSPPNLQGAMNALAAATFMGPGRHVSKAEAAMSHLPPNFDMAFELAVVPNARILVRGRIFVSTVVTPQFKISLVSPSSTSEPGGESAVKTEGEPSPRNLLADAYPPSNDQYPNVDEVMYYLRRATTRVLAQTLGDVAAERLGNNDIFWDELPEGPAVVDGEREEKALHLDIGLAEDGRSTLTAEAKGDVATGSNRVWSWHISSGTEGPKSENLEDVVLEVMRRETKGR